MCFMGKICKLCSCAVVILVLVTLVFGFGWLSKAKHACVEGHSMQGKCNGSALAPSPAALAPSLPRQPLAPPALNQSALNESAAASPGNYTTSAGFNP